VSHVVVEKDLVWMPSHCKRDSPLSGGVSAPDGVAYGARIVA
jgi:hypothetical protein